METKFLLAEEPFISIQGEGRTAGRVSYFLRFSGCPVKCSFCDTPYTFDGSEPVIKKPLSEIADDIAQSKVNNIIITGGEPILYQDNILRLISMVSDINRTFEIETSGSILMYDDFLVGIKKHLYANQIIFNISPKLQYIKDNPESENILLENIQRLWNFNISFILKFVYEKEKEKEKDIIALKNRILSNCGSINIAREVRNRIYIMPECKTREEQLDRFEETLKFCSEHNLIFAPRLHILLYDKKRRV